MSTPWRSSCERWRLYHVVEAILILLTIICHTASAQRFHHASTKVISSTIITIGGRDNSNIVTSVLSTNLNRQLTRSLTFDISVTGHSVISLNESRVMLLFGQTQLLPTALFPDPVRILDLSSGALSTLSSNGPPISRVAHTATVVGERVFLIGGQVPDPQTPRILGDVSYLNLTSHTWTLVKFSKTHPPPPIALHSTVAVGKYLVTCFGVNDKNAARSDCTIFDTDELAYIDVTYASSNVPPPPRTYATMVLGLNGQSLVAFGGGNDLLNQRYNDLWILDISKIPLLSWSQQSTNSDFVNVTPSGRTGHSAVLVGPNSDIMMIYGGQTSVTSAGSSFYYLDLNTMKWISGAMVQALYSITRVVRGTKPGNSFSSSSSSSLRTTTPNLSQGSTDNSNQEHDIAIVVAVVGAVSAVGLAMIFWLVRRRLHNLKNESQVLPSSQLHSPLNSPLNSPPNSPISMLGPSSRPTDSMLLVRAPPKAIRWLGRSSLFGGMGGRMMVDGQFSANVNMVELKRGNEHPCATRPESLVSDGWSEHGYKEENVADPRKSSKSLVRPKRNSSLPNILIVKEPTSVGAAFIAGNKVDDNNESSLSIPSIPPTPASISDAESNDTQNSAMPLLSAASTEQTKRRLTLNLKPVGLFRVISDASSSSSQSSTAGPSLPSRNMISPTSASAAAAVRMGKAQPGKRSSSFFVNRPRQNLNGLPSPIAENPGSRASVSSTGNRSVVSLQWVGFDHRMDPELTTRRSVLMVRNARDSLNSSNEGTPRNSLGVGMGESDTMFGGGALHVRNLRDNAIECVSWDAAADDDENPDENGFRNGPIAVERMSGGGGYGLKKYQSHKKMAYEYTTSQQNIEHDTDSGEQSSTSRTSMSPSTSPQIIPVANENFSHAELNYNAFYRENSTLLNSGVDDITVAHNETVAYTETAPVPTITHKRSMQLSRMSFGIQDQERGLFEEPDDENDTAEYNENNMTKRASLADNFPMYPEIKQVDTGDQLYVASAHNGA